MGEFTPRTAFTSSFFVPLVPAQNKRLSLRVDEGLQSVFLSRWGAGGLLPSKRQQAEKSRT